MAAIESYRSLIEEAIDRWIGSLPDNSLYAPMIYIMRLPAKRVRPCATLMACEMFGSPAETALDAALAVELFHNFTLMHDDIMDHAPLRRGHATVHEKWNISTAILSGDAMLVKAYEMLSRHPAVVPIFNANAIAVCEGQQSDMDFEKRGDVGLQEYMEMIHNKTARLLGCALQMGAAIAGASVEDQERIAGFGGSLGTAFQLRDDLLDVYGDASKFGKQVGGDILANKKTYLLLKAFETANVEQLEKLQFLAGDGNVNPEEKVSQTLAIYDELSIREKSEAVMQQYFEQAMEDLNAVSVPEERKTELSRFAEMLLVRES